MALAAPLTFESEFVRPGPPQRQYAFVRLSFRSAASFSFVSRASWPDQIIPFEVAGFERAIERGVLEALEHLGTQKFAVSLESIRVEPNISTQMAFKVAASLCVQTFYGAVMSA